MPKPTYDLDHLNPWTNDEPPMARPSMTDLPLRYQPDTESPDLAHVADMVRNLMAQGRYAVQYLAPGPNPDDGLSNVNTLDIKRAWGPAPWAGKPFIYLWDVAVSMPAGRSWIAGPTRIQHTGPTWP